MVFGLVLGVAVVVADRFFASARGGERFTHLPFPLSPIASATAGIGEEVLFRSFVMGLWAFLLNLILRRWAATRVALWIGNIVAALAFGAGHLPGAMFILGVTSPTEIPSPVLGEIFPINGIIGLVAGERCICEGLVAAVGVHFWTDVVWHVVWPSVGLGW